MPDKSTALVPTGEFLLFQSNDGRTRVQVRLQNNTVWLTQRQMAQLYGTSASNINQHLAGIFEEEDFSRHSTVEQYLITANEGSRRVTRSIEHYAFRQKVTELLQQ